MRIAHVTSDAGLGGSGRHLLELLASPVWSSDECFVLSPPGELAERLRQAAAGRWVALALPMRPRSFDLVGLLHLTRAFRRLKPEVVHAHASLSARLAARAAGVPVVLHTRHGSSRRESAQWRSGRLRPLRRALERALADHAVAVCRALAEELVADGAPRERVHLVPSGIDPSPYREAPARRDLWRARLGAAPGDVLVVGTGRLVSEKGWDDWLAAAACARSQLAALGEAAPLRFAVAGEGPERARLVGLARELGFPHETFVGFVEDVPGLLAAADVFMLLSRREGLATAAIEAMHAGLPVVATAVGGTPEAVEDGATGRVVPPGDREAASRALLALARDPELRRLWGEAGRRRARREFTAERMASATRDLYVRLLEAARW
ncbi:MAG: glycosyltransferase [Clostridia bacterium]|nr:glycosyltransferase [Clostridia bacterium]